MKFEKYFFYLLVLVHVVPVLLLPYFVTHDGPAHVYNTNLLHRMLFDQDPSGALYFHFNPQILPNWISHILLELFNFFLSPASSERLVVAIYFISYPLAFRALVLAINPTAFAGAYLVFPYLQAFSILTGLYSFCLGLSLLFYVLYLWQKSEEHSSKKKYMWFSIWMLLIYFSHLFVFMLAFLALAVMISWKHFIDHGPALKNIFNKVSHWIKDMRWLVLISVIPLILTFIFAFNQASKTDTEIPEFKNLLELFIDVRPIIALNYDMEKVYSKPFFFIYLILLMAALIARIVQARKGDKKFLKLGDGWFILFLMMTIFYFSLPDDIFSGGIVAIRFCLMSYTFLILWLAAFAPDRLVWPAAALSILASVLLLIQRHPALQSLSNDAEDFSTCADHISEGSSLMTLNYSDNWMLDHIASYVAGEKDIVLLENYEAKQAHFPLMWNENRSPELTGAISGKKNRPCMDLKKYKEVSGLDIDYILVMKRPQELNDSCTVLVDAQLKDSYREVFVTPGQVGVLYERIKTE